MARQSQNIQVAVRVRPLLEYEHAQDDRHCFEVNDKLNSVTLAGTERTSYYDNVFDTKSSQQQVYEDSAMRIVNDFLNGANGCVLAYGQTGSGKSYTMGTTTEAGSVAGDGVGVLPRAIEQTFQFVKQQEQVHGSKCEVSVQFVELYNEQLYDLLDMGTTPQPASTISLRATPRGNNVAALGASQYTVTCTQEALDVMLLGCQNRACSATYLNAQSSRSHAIFSVHLSVTGQHGHTTRSKLQLVDLAGSERTKKSGAQGDRFKESVHINQGLLTLSTVMSMLSDPNKEGMLPPFRQSKLTRLLQDCLGGSARTLLLTCVSACSLSLDESLITLAYASRAKRIVQKGSMQYAELGSQGKALYNRIKEALHAESCGKFDDGGTVKALGSVSGCQMYQLMREMYREKNISGSEARGDSQMCMKMGLLLRQWSAVGRVVTQWVDPAVADDLHAIIAQSEFQLNELEQEISSSRRHNSDAGFEARSEQSSARGQEHIASTSGNAIMACWDQPTPQKPLQSIGEPPPKHQRPPSDLPKQSCHNEQLVLHQDSGGSMESYDRVVYQLNHSTSPTMDYSSSTQTTSIASGSQHGSGAVSCAGEGSRSTLNTVPTYQQVDSAQSEGTAISIQARGLSVPPIDIARAQSLAHEALVNTEQYNKQHMYKGQNCVIKADQQMQAGYTASGSHISSIRQGGSCEQSAWLGDKQVLHQHTNNTLQVYSLIERSGDIIKYGGQINGGNSQFNGVVSDEQPQQAIDMGLSPTANPNNNMIQNQQQNNVSSGHSTGDVPVSSIELVSYSAQASGKRSLIKRLSKGKMGKA